jgi:glutamate formiminotransferase
VLFECVPNVSEGRDDATLEACARAIADAGATLAHRTSDSIHHRSVFTFFGERSQVLAAAVALAEVTAQRIDLRTHRGAHPRIGALDVLPFVPLAGATMDDAVALAREAAARIWQRTGVPCFLYGAAATSERRRLLADVRAGEFEGLVERAHRTGRPDVGDVFTHPSAGATAVGARNVLVAYNVVLGTGDVRLARTIARNLRERDGGLRTLRVLGVALDMGRVQISCNLTDVAGTPLYRVFELVRRSAARYGVNTLSSELIGLVPRSALSAVAAHALGVASEGLAAADFVADSAPKERALVE